MEAYRQKIEQYGVVMESMGLTPVAARIFVYLLFSQLEQATFEALISYFSVSKSAVSVALKMLSSVNMVDSKTVGGQRKRYFRVNFEKMLDQQEMTARFQIYSTMLDDVRKSRSRDDEFANELLNVSSFYKMMIVEFPIIFERWKRLTTLDNQTT
ncbi:GbsR/MarR family transcriptional regulator [Spirosoma migulaei]